MTTRCALALVLALIALTGSGCWFGTDSTSDLRYEYTRQTGVVLEPEFGVKLGRISTGFGKMFAGGADSDVPKLKGVHKVEVGVYAVADGFASDPTRSAALGFPGWSQLVRVREDDEDVLVLVKPELDGTIPAMLVLVNDGDEVVMVRLKGKLHKFMRANLDEILESVADVGEAMNDIGEAVADIG